MEEAKTTPRLDMADASRRAKVLSIYMTFPDGESAAEIARALVSDGLVACVNILPGARSLYLWEGSVHDDPEVVAFAKSTEARLPSIVELVNELHPYDTPCVVALHVEGGDRRYLDWVEDSTR